jgi:cupin 2 domain-containing protein
MNIKKGNIFSNTIMPADGTELTEIIHEDSKFRAERIVSDGQFTTEGFWYDQPGNEWVILLQGDAVVEFEESGNVPLSKGDYLLIPSHVKHRVKYTSAEPKCIWLAIHSV